MACICDDIVLNCRHFYETLQFIIFLLTFNVLHRNSTAVIYHTIYIINNNGFSDFTSIFTVAKLKKLRL